MLSYPQTIHRSYSAGLLVFFLTDTLNCVLSGYVLEVCLVNLRIDTEGSCWGLFYLWPHVHLIRMHVGNGRSDISALRIVAEVEVPLIFGLYLSAATGLLQPFPSSFKAVAPLTQDPRTDDGNGRFSTNFNDGSTLWPRKM